MMLSYKSFENAFKNACKNKVCFNAKRKCRKFVGLC